MGLDEGEELVFFNTTKTTKKDNEICTKILKYLIDKTVIVNYTTVLDIPTYLRNHIAAMLAEKDKVEATELTKMILLYLHKSGVSAIPIENTTSWIVEKVAKIIKSG